MWAEDNPALVLSELTLRETPAEWRRRKAARWEGTFLKLPITELKKVCTGKEAIHDVEKVHAKRIRQKRYIIRGTVNLSPEKRYTRVDGNPRFEKSLGKAVADSKKLSRREILSEIPFANELKEVHKGNLRGTRGKDNLDHIKGTWGEKGNTRHG